MPKVQPSVQLLISGGREEHGKRAEGPTCGEGEELKSKGFSKLPFHIEILAGGRSQADFVNVKQLGLRGKKGVELD